MRCMMHMAQEAFEQCISVEIDAPIKSLLTVNDAVYRDPYGWMAELLHFRSYGDLTVSRQQWGCNVTDWKDTRTYLHGTPNCYLRDDSNYMPVEGSGGRIGKFDFDPCLFHAMFRPSTTLKSAIERYWEKMKPPNVIGIHLRTGDLAAFGIHNKDQRIALADTSKIGDTTRILQDVLNSMFACARNHARQLLPDVPEQQITYFLATDNQQAKSFARSINSRSDEEMNIYTTDIPLHSWLRADGDDNAWLEIFLLSKTKGIVANVRVTDYHGQSDVISTFPRLAAKIGFMSEHQFLHCKLE